MLNLSNVTLVAIDCIHPQDALEALKKSTESIRFGRAILLTNNPSSSFSGSIEQIKIPGLDSGEEVSFFMLRDLIDHIDTEFMLNIQADGFVVNSKAWTDEFLEYDYIGAPWKSHPHHYWPPFPDIKESTRVGNGGFSLRSRGLMKTVAKAFKTLLKNPNSKYHDPTAYHPEDCLICRVFN